MLKRIFVGILFAVLALGFLVDFSPLSAQQGACGECGEPVGISEDCPDNSLEATRGPLEGNCLRIDAVTKTGANMQPQTCMRVSFYDCNYAKAGEGCPLSAIGSGCGGG